jgi:RHS repeat-associated protein
MPPHSTGKERDAESGNDYFGARYYGSGMGRFLLPDWAAKLAGSDPVPYADLDNPQSLNLYEYVGNNPLVGVDSDGHCYMGGEDGYCLGTAAVMAGAAFGHGFPGDPADDPAAQQKSPICPECLQVQSKHPLRGSCDPSSDAFCGILVNYFYSHMRKSRITAPNNYGQKLRILLSGFNQLKPASEAQETVEFWVANHIAIPGAMIASGAVLAYGGAVASIGLCATIAGCVASPITGSVAVAGVGLAAEGVYYGITQSIWDPFGRH